MTALDLDLLTSAAKAAGYEFGVINDKPKVRRDGMGACGTWGCARHDLHDWNPLTDDGDALRLAVRLNLDVFSAGGFAYAIAEGDEFDEAKVPHEGDPYAATRRAIVKAAAAIAQGANQ